MKYLIRATYHLDAVVKADSEGAALDEFNDCNVFHGDTEFFGAEVADTLDTPEKVEQALRFGAEDMTDDG